MEKITFRLTPINGRKSFYGKANVLKNDNIYKLLSYSSIVAEYDSDTKKMTVHGYYSRTTMAHINSFFSIFGFYSCTKKELEQKYLKQI